jgi:putative PIN family toxin of toxin-antitoxin system
MSEEKYKVVFDAMVFLQATTNEESPAAHLFDLLEEKKIALFVSQEMLREVRDLLERPQIRAHFLNLTDARVEALFRRLNREATSIQKVPKVFDYPRDPKDEPYINLAVAAEVDYLITRDTDLLDLMTGYTQECKEFRQRFRPLKVIDPVAFLKIIATSQNT